LATVAATAFLSERPKRFLGLFLFAHRSRERERVCMDKVEMCHPSEIPADKKR